MTIKIVEDCLKYLSDFNLIDDYEQRQLVQNIIVKVNNENHIFRYLLYDKHTFKKFFVFISIVLIDKPHLPVFMKHMSDKDFDSVKGHDEGVIFPYYQNNLMVSLKSKLFYEGVFSIKFNYDEHFTIESIGFWVDIYKSSFELATISIDDIHIQRSGLNFYKTKMFKDEVELTISALKQIIS